METTILTIKGQMVIPARIRRKLGLMRGSKLVVREIDHGFVVYPLDRSYYEQFAGIVGTRGKTTKALLEERRKDREREEKSM